jgi:hypothetical protein
MLRILKPSQNCLSKMNSKSNQSFEPTPGRRAAFRGRDGGAVQFERYTIKEL